MPTVNDIRDEFLGFFRGHAHEIVPSSPVVPHDDPTLLFTNAGMNQFKDVFLGTGSRPYRRAADTQKCIRAGGKHNDLDDVGKDTYHHTFFEMLGNWSFGDYFKKEAILWAWQLLTETWRLDKSKLHVTVFEGDASEGLAPDEEAAEIWRNVAGVDPSHIHRGKKKDNFWEMGETGPCGPCTEIHIDRTPDKSGGKLVNAGDARVMEIWNLVFIQFNRGADKKLTPLPAKHVDTGMGFERICSVLQGKDSNYDTGVFEPIMHAIADVAKQKYLHSLTSPPDIAFRVIADHLRMATFSIADGAKPGNKKRDAVLRSVIRRAVRYGYQELGLKEPFLHRLVPTLTATMGGAFPELRREEAKVQDILRAEEEDFLKVIDRGLGLFDEAVTVARNGFEELDLAIRSAGRQYEVANPSPSGSPARERPPLTEREIAHCAKYPKAKYPRPVVSADDLFLLHSTHGFPADMAAQLARDKELDADMAGFEKLREEHERKSRGDKPADVVVAVDLEGIDKVPATEFVGYQSESVANAHLVGLWNAKGKHIERGISHDLAGDSDYSLALALDKSPFYVEAGGQVGDVGTIFSSYGRMEVQKVVKVQGAGGPVVVHYGKVVDGVIQGGPIHGTGASPNRYTAEVDAVRRDTMRHHTATHLMNWALRKVLGDDVQQKSSLVDQDKTRFGFSHNKPVSAEEIAEVERLVNAKIYADVPVNPKVMPLAEAKAITGLRAVFGERYPDPVRVLMIGAEDPAKVTMEHSVEFCGGTHVHRTGEIGFFKIVSEEAESKGVRRLTAVTGKKAVEHVQKMDALLGDLAARLHVRPDDLPARVEALQAQIKELDKQLKKGATADLTGVFDALLEAAPTFGAVRLIVGEVPKAPDDAIRGAIDRIKKKAGEAAFFLGAREDGKATLYAAASPAAVAKGVHSGKLLTEVAAIVGGKGGGRPEGVAQGGGPQTDKLPDALAKAKELLAKTLG